MRRWLFPALGTALFGLGFYLILSLAADLDPAPAVAPSAVVVSVPAETLRACSVTVKVADGSGSGVVILRAGRAYVWTAAHVVAHTKPSVAVEIVQDTSFRGRLSGKIVAFAHVIRCDTFADLALLSVDAPGLFSAGASFDLSPSPLPLGTELAHVGSFLGDLGSQSFSTGVMSYVGRHSPDPSIWPDLDQITCTAFPGSSGGGVFVRATGRVAGLLVGAAGETFTFMVPARAIVAWAKVNRCAWAVDPGAPLTE